MKKYKWSLTLIILLAGCGSKQAPFAPDEALKSFSVEPGWKVELYAAEPLIADPVAMEVDEDGRTYVVQNSGYPLDTEHGLGKVWLLEDTDGDGKADKSVVFAENFTLPTGVMRWKKGILVTDAPNVWYLEDTDGDGHAEVRKAVLTGFAKTNPQHTVNSPTYGLDNWIYLAHEGFASAVVYTEKFGDKGGDIHFADRPGGPVVKNERRNVRFRPDTFQLETTSSTSQFGIAFDDYGHLLTANNSNHAREEVVAAGYLARNPDLLAASTMQDVSDHGAAAQVFSIVKNPRFELLSGTGVFTSACGITWWRGGTLIAEPVHGIVHRDIWKPKGATFTASREREGVEFVASTDPWFRPVNFYNGPDGAVYLVDYYRKVIEHPEWTSRETAEAKDIYDGQTKGRIYRIVEKDAKGGAARPRLSSATVGELVGHLENPGIWWRRTAQRLLVDRNDLAAVGPLRAMAKGGRTALGRLHALWTLQGMGKLEAADVVAALADGDAGVRENAVRLAEGWLGDAAVRKALVALEGDGEARVRFQLLLTLGSAPGTEAVRKRLLDRDMEDRWFAVAALSASGDAAMPALEEGVRGQWAETAGRAVYVEQLGSIVGARGRAAELARVFALANGGKGWWRAPLLEGVAAGLRARNGKLAPQEVLLSLYGDAAVRHAALGLLQISGLPEGRRAAVLAGAAKTAGDRALGDGERADAVGLLALAGEGAPGELLRKLVDPAEPEAVQAAAARALGKRAGVEEATFLLGKWRSLTPAVRNVAGDAAMATPERFALLLGAIDKGDIQPWSLSLRQRIQMQMNKDPQLRERARALLAAKGGDREAVLKKYEAALTKDGDAGQGKAVFERVCAKCHRMDGVGAEVGPDLATVRNRTASSLLGDILMPSRSIAQMYEAYVVETSAGSYEGVMGQQTATTITLVHEQGKQDVISRAQIKQMFVSNLSAMPEDLDKEVTPAQMVDLLAYLKKPR